MEVRWPRSSSTSLQFEFLLEFAEELWFYNSIIPFPFISFPCLSALLSSFNSYPDTSTLLAQLMFSTTGHPPAVSSSPPPSSPSHPPLQTPGSPFVDSWDHRLYAVPSEYESSEEEDASYLRHNHEGYHNVNLTGTRCCKIKDQIHSLHAHSDVDTEQDGEESLKQELAVPANVSSKYQAVDAVSGLLDVGVLLKGQQYKGVDGDTHEFGREDMLDDMLLLEWPKMTDAHSVQVDQKSKDMKGSIDVEACGEADATCGVPSVRKRFAKSG